MHWVGVVPSLKLLERQGQQGVISLPGALLISWPVDQRSLWAAVVPSPVYFVANFDCLLTFFDFLLSAARPLC